MGSLVIGLSLAEQKSVNLNPGNFLTFPTGGEVIFKELPSLASSDEINLGITPIDPICEGEDIILSPTSSSDEAYAYEWYEVLEDGSEIKISSEKTRRVRDLKKTSTFRLKAYYVNGELITQGDFGTNQSDINWLVHGSDYDRIYTFPSNRTLWDEGTYHIGINPKLYHSHFSSVGDHTTGFGNMFMVNGSENFGDRVWYQNGISVEPYRTYVFSAWGKSLTVGNPAKLIFSINGIEIGPLNLDSNLKEWNEFYVLWNSGGAIQADISLINSLTNGSGNDFALDDISLAPMIEVVRTIEVKVQPVIDIEKIEVGSVCLGKRVTVEAILFSGNDGGASMQWTRDGVPVNEPNVTFNGTVMTIDPFQEFNEGTYQFSMSNDCYSDNMLTDLFLKAPTVIDKQPVSANVCVGEDVTFSIVVSGGALGFQWYHNGVAISGATGSELKINTTLADAGTYKCQIVDDCDGLESEEVTLVVNENTTLTKDFTLDPICSGGDITMAVDATGSGTLHYQWYRGTAKISDATDKQYSFVAKMEDDGVNYYCVVSSSTYCGTATSSTRTLNVFQSTIINSSPSNASACVGSSHTFTVDAVAENIAYQWQFEGGDIEGATSASFVLNNIQLGDAGAYRCIVSGECGPLESAPATLIVHETTRITNTLPIQELCVGSDVTYSVSTEGTITKYTWKHNGVDLNKDSNSITLYDISGTDTGDIEVRVDGVCGSQTKNTSLTVLPLTKIIDGPANIASCVGGIASFSVIAEGDQLTYNWDFLGNKIGDKTSLNLSGIETSDAGTYNVTISGTCGNASASANLTVNAITRITSGFVDQTACETENVILSVATEGNNNTFKWFKDGSLVDGETTASLILNNVLASNSGIYKCEVTGDCGSDEIQARLDVYKNTAITTAVADVEECVGNSASFSVVVEGENLSYVWTKGGVDQGENTSSFSIPTLLASDVGTQTIECTVTGTCGSSQVSSADLTVYPTTDITAGITDTEKCVGEDITFTVTAVAEAPAYEWWHGGTQLAEVTNTLTLANVGVVDAGNYKCIVKGRCGEDESTAVLTIRENVVQNIGLSDLTLCEGADATLSVDFSGTDLQYEWKKDGTGIGTNQNTFALTDIPLANNGSNYTCKVFSPYGCGDVTESMILGVNPQTSVSALLGDQIVCEGGAANFAVDVAGTGPFTYQWYQGTNLQDGETNSSLVVTPVTLGHDGKTYHYTVTGTCGSATSNSAKLKVNENVSIVSHPSSIIVSDGGTATFFVAAEGAPTLEYQWYEEGAIMPGETNSSLSVTASEIANDGFIYYCVVTSTTGCGSVTSEDAVLTVDVTAIVQEPESKVVCDGENVVFTCKAEGDVTFQWEKTDGTLMSSSEVKESDGPPRLWRSEMTLSAALADNGTQYKCNVEGPLGLISSRVVTLTVNKNNSISDPANQTVCPNAEAVFEVTAEGDGTFSYEWFDEGNNSVGTDRVLVLQGTLANAAKTYYCEVSSTTGCGTPRSNPASLSLYLNTSIDQDINDAPKCVGGEKNFEVVVTATEPVFSWTHNGNPTGWGNVSSHTIAPIVLGDAGTYVVTVDGKCGSAQSSANFQVKEFPNITQFLTDQTKCEGEDLDLTVDATGSDLAYKWYKDNVLDLSVTGKKFSLTNLSKANDAVAYRCEISNICATETTSAQLTLKTPVSIVDVLHDPDACVGENVILEVKAEGDDKVYQWFKGGNPVGLNESTFSLTSAVEADAGQYAVRISGYCNEKTSSSDVTINKNIRLESGFSGGDYCEGDDIVLAVFADGVDLHYDWTKDDLAVFGDQNEIVISRAKIEDSGRYKCIVTGKCGNPVTVEEDVNVHPVTNINVAFSPDESCEGATVTLENQVVGDDLNFIWTLDGGDLSINSSTLVLNNVQPNQSGLYSMRVSGICGDDIASAPILIKEGTGLKNSLNSSEVRCEGAEMIYSVSATGHNVEYEWYYDGNLIPSETTNQLQISNLVADNSGGYLCKVIGECGILETSSDLIVHPVTKILSSYDDTKVCEGSDISLEMDVEGADITFKWDHDGIVLPHKSSNLDIEGADLNQSGSYTCNVLGVCGEVKNVAELDVCPQAVLNSQTGDQKVCETDPMVSFEVNVTGDDLIYQWKKNGTRLTGKNNPLLIISPVRIEDAGSYICEVSTSCGNPIASEPAQLVVNPRAKIVLQPEGHDLCEDSDLELKIRATGLELNYQWRKEGVDIPGAIDTVYNISKVKLDNAGTYDCVVSSFCGPVLYSSEVSVTVETQPKSKILGRMELCGGEERVLYQAPFDPDLNYSWNVENGAIGSGQDTRFLEVNWDEAAQGVIHLEVSSIGNGCTLRVDSVVNLFPLPKVSLAEFDTIGICKSSFDLFGANIEGGVYHVDGEPSKIFEMGRGAGEYIINYTYTDNNGCSASSEYRTLVVNPMPTVRAYQRDIDMGRCKEIRLSAQSTEQNYNWGPSLNLDAPNVRAPIFTPGESQRLRVRVTDRFGCSAHDYVYIEVDSAPDIETLSDTVIGECQRIKLTTENWGGFLERVEWNNGEDLDQSDVLSPLLEQPRVGTTYYTVTAVDPYGCVDRDSVKIIVQPALDLGPDRMQCEGEEVILNLDGNYKSLLWDDGYIGNTRVLNQVGNYHILAEDSFGCIDELDVTIHPEPIINLRDTFIFKGQFITLEPNLDSRYGPYSYEWQDGSSYSTLETYDEGRYRIFVRDHIGCESAKEIFLEVKEPFIKVPNAFMPDATGENSRFFVKEVNFITDFTLYVYNRWGKLMFSSKEIGYHGGWDGTYKGQKCQGGAYVWMIFSEGKVLEHGSVTLIR
jgi:gliding motility-associated-like protein